MFLGRKKREVPEGSAESVVARENRGWRLVVPVFKLSSDVIGTLLLVLTCIYCFYDAQSTQTAQP